MIANLKGKSSLTSEFERRETFDDLGNQQEILETFHLDDTFVLW